MAGDEKGEDQLKAVSFAAGTAACMACIQRAIVVSVFVHWRVWAFLALNLLLLAIIVTSRSQNIPVDRENCGISDFKKKKKTRQECGLRISTNDGENRDDLVEDEMKDVENDGRKEDYDELSKEELNERVEAFIAMFRQHLVSDAKGKSYVLHYVASGQVDSPQCLSLART